MESIMSFSEEYQRRSYTHHRQDFVLRIIRQKWYGKNRQVDEKVQRTQNGGDSSEALSSGHAGATLVKCSELAAKRRGGAAGLQFASEQVPLGGS
jgi:hypothetical protein